MNSGKSFSKAMVTLVSFFLMVSAFSAAWATTYYVDPNGMNSSGRDGSMTQPWASLSYACSRVLSGNHVIYINTGSYTDNTQCILPVGVDIEGAGVSSVTINSALGSSGTAYIQGHSTPYQTMVDGSHEISGFTLNGSSRTLQVGISTRGRSNINVHDVNFLNIRFCALRIVGYDVDFGGWPDHNIAPNWWGTGVTVSNVTVTNCGVNAAGNGGWNTGAIMLDCLKGAVVSGITVNNLSGTQTGVGIKTESGWLDSCEFKNSTFSMYLSNGDAFPLEFTYGMQNDVLIHDNTFNHMVSIVRNGPVSLVPGSSWHVQVFNNTWIMGLNAPALEGSHRYMRVYNNYIDAANTGSGIQFAHDNIGIAAGNATLNSQADHNVIYRPNSFGCQIYDYGNITGANFFNNTIANSSGVGIRVARQGSTFDTINIKNNVIMNSNGAAVSIDNASQSVRNCTVTYNCFSGNGTNNVSGYQSTYNATVSNNKTTAPGIQGTGARPDPYYRPVSASSETVDAGVDVGLPYQGSAPDMGRFEYVGAIGGGPPMPPSAVRLM